jgi:hypothetical protein
VDILTPPHLDLANRHAVYHLGASVHVSEAHPAPDPTHTEPEVGPRHDLPLPVALLPARSGQELGRKLVDVAQAIKVIPVPLARSKPVAWASVPE